MKVLLLAAALLLPATGPSFAHDETRLVQVHQFCRGHAAPHSPAKHRNTVFQKCLRDHLSGETCRHKNRGEARRAHDAKHTIQVHRQCRFATALICHSVKSRSRCESAVTHDCLKTEDLCVARGFGRNPNSNRVPSAE